MELNKTHHLISWNNLTNSKQVFVSAIISKYMESKCKRKSTIGLDNIHWALSPRTLQIHGNNNGGEDAVDEFYSIGSRLSRCSSATSFETFVSVKKWLPRSSSLHQTNLCDFDNRSMIMEVCHYEGWPFGLCRKALLLPPLPKSPADSWSWRKSVRTVRIHGWMDVFRMVFWGYNFYGSRKYDEIRKIWWNKRSNNRRYMFWM